MRPLPILAALLLAASPALAAPKHDAGRKIAEQCMSCHAIGPKGASPHRKAPPFRTLARKYPLDHLQEGFAEGIVVGHSEMPNFRLTPEQIDAFLRYLKSIQR